MILGLHKDLWEFHPKMGLRKEVFSLKVVFEQVGNTIFDFIMNSQQNNNYSLFWF